MKCNKWQGYRTQVLSFHLYSIVTTRIGSKAFYSMLDYFRYGNKKERKIILLNSALVTCVNSFHPCLILSSHVLSHTHTYTLSLPLQSRNV